MPRRPAWPLALIAATVLAIGFAACGDGADSATHTPTPTVTPTAATPSATAAASAPAAATPAPPRTPPPADPNVPGHPLERRTGVAGVDRAIEAMLSGDPERIRRAIVYSQVLCVANPQGAGAPPKCPAGAANNTPVLVFQTASCEASFPFPDQTGPVLERAAQPGKKLYAVWQVDANAPVTLLFAGPPEQPGGAISATSATLNSFGITGITFGCNADPKTRLEQLRAANFIIPPPD